MSTSTSRLALYKPADDGSEFVDVSTDLNQNLDKIDAAIGFIPATSSTPPTTTFPGMARQDTDTNRTYLRNGADSAWVEIPNAASTYDADYKAVSGKKIGLGTTPSSIIDVNHTNSTDLPARFKAAADSTHRMVLGWNGLEIGPGNAARDVFLYRSGVSEATLDATLSVTNDLEVAGLTTVDDITVGGDLSINGTILTDLDVTGDFQAHGIGARFIKYKATDLNRLSTATPANDPDLVVPLLANATYLFKLVAMWGSPAAADFRSGWNFPTGSTGLKYCLGPASGATSRDSTTMRTGVHALTSNVDYGADATGYTGVLEHGMIVTAATAGDLNYKWSQTTSTASNTTLSFCSFLEVIRVA